MTPEARPRCETLAELLVSRGHEHAARPLLHAEGGSATYAEILADASRIAGWIAAQGIEPGAHMASLLPNGRALVTALFGAILAGVVVVPLDPRLRAPEIRFLAQHCRCRAVLTDAATTLSLDLASCPEIACHDALRAPPKGASAARRARDPAVILATSGSTAAPKAVVLSHRNLLTNQRSVGDLYGFGPDDVFLTALSLFHSFGLTACLFAAVDHGASVITTADVQPARLAALASRHGLLRHGVALSLSRPRRGAGRVVPHNPMLPLGRGAARRGDGPGLPSALWPGHRPDLRPHRGLAGGDGQPA